MSRKRVVIDGNEAAAYVAYHTNEVIAIYPITPSSPMGEWSDAWMAGGKKNIWGGIPGVTEMQSEGGAVGAVHGSLQAGSLTTTFTASQGLLLMIPNMYKIAGELTPTVFHVAARSLAAQGLSIFGDHSDVMATRQTGFAMLSSNSVQEVMDFALISQSATLESRIPFLHFFDGFRTSHEEMKIEMLDIDDMKKMIDDELVFNFRKLALTPDAPVIRGTAQNPDVYFQARETVNPYYTKVPGIVQKRMDQFASITGRQYKLYEYYGHPQAERVIIIMGSGAEAVRETVDHLNEQGEKIGMLMVRLYRPFASELMLSALPKTTKSIAVLDRCKEPGSAGEPLYLDVIGAFTEAMMSDKLPFSFPKIVGGRYGLSSKEFTPAMIKAIYDELKKSSPKNHFTIGIDDDVTHTSLNFDADFSIEKSKTFRGMFYGLGADGTVSANKNSIKIIGETTDNYAQGYYVYDSKKSGSMTTSHLRFGKEPIHSTYLIKKANFIAVHLFTFFEKYDILSSADVGATLLVNSPYPTEETWDRFPVTVQREIIAKKIKLYAIDAYKVARETGMGGRINTIMQTCFFYISGILPEDEAITKIKESIRSSFGKKGEELVQQNFKAVDQAISNLKKIDVPSAVSSKIDMPATVSGKAPAFVKSVLATILRGEGDSLPVSALPADGTYPVATARWEKRNISLEIPAWEPELCIQCGKCALICPHAVIRIKAYEPKYAESAPKTFKSVPIKGADWPENTRYTIQVAPEDCTGCTLCVEVCPESKKEKRRSLSMVSQPPLRETERENWDYFLDIPEYDRTKIKSDSVKGSQFLEPLFEFSGACAGCGETPYLKLVTQLFGDRLMVANATGCSSIYGGNLPTTPWAKNREGRGPSWSNSLFEDNAEFGLGMRLAVDQKNDFAKMLLKRVASDVGDTLVKELLESAQTDEIGIYEQRKRVETLRSKLASNKSSDAKQLLSVADYLVKKSVWIVGGDGWAYDIGYGGLDHVLASGKNVNILVLDTEVYSNTGGQMSKATPLGAIAKFAAGGKPTGKKDLGLIAMAYGNVYVAQLAVGASDIQTVKAIQEAEAYEGVSLLIAYSHCIAHGYDLTKGLDQQKKAVDSAYWPLYRFHPDRHGTSEPPLKLDSKDPKIPLKDFLYNEARFKMLTKINPSMAEKLFGQAQKDAEEHWSQLKGLSGAASEKKD